jgi:hypothetical protein
MDEYFISKEDWDTLVELGVDERRDDLVTKKIATATKTALTRKCVAVLLVLFLRWMLTMLCMCRYNAKEHPIPFHKAADLGKAPKKLAGAGPAPDLEDAFEVCHSRVLRNAETERAHSSMKRCLHQRKRKMWRMTTSPRISSSRRRRARPRLRAGRARPRQRKNRKRRRRSKCLTNWLMLGVRGSDN